MTPSEEGGPFGQQLAPTAGASPGSQPVSANWSTVAAAPVAPTPSLSRPPAPTTAYRCPALEQGCHVSRGGAHRKVTSAASVATRHGGGAAVPWWWTLKGKCDRGAAASWLPRGREVTSMRIGEAAASEDDRRGGGDHVAGGAKW